MAAHSPHAHALPRAFHVLIAAQFCSALADNALLIVCVALLLDQGAPGWWAPLLKFSFTIAYVVLAPCVGAWADAVKKGRMMLAMNLVKVLGLALLLLGSSPLLAMTVVGVGAAAYAPAKYGLVTELVPARGLVAANGWIEVTTVCAVVLGTVLGGFLISPWARGAGLQLLPGAAALTLSLVSLLVLYGLAALLNLGIPDSGARYPGNPLRLRPMVRGFADAQRRLWADSAGALSMAVTTLFWGAGATLQFIVLKWAEVQLGLPLDKGAILQGMVAVGIALGAVTAARFVPLKKSLQVLPFGVAMGFVVILMVFVHSAAMAYVLCIIIGAMAGYFVVPMNALLQHRGHVMLSAGHSIAVQNFNENLNILIMLGLYALMIRSEFSINTVIVMFGLFVSGTMALVMIWNRSNHRRQNLDHLIGEAKH